MEKTLLKIFDNQTDEIGSNDTLVFHWVGHGAMTRSEGKQVLFLPNLAHDDKPASSEFFLMDDLTNWIGKKCNASRQAFFFDCCRTDNQAPRDMLNAHNFSRSDLPNTGSVQQSILIGSGVYRSAKGKKRQPSYFTKAIERAFTSYSCNKSGEVAIGKSLESIVASIILELWLKNGDEGLPETNDLCSKKKWIRKLAENIEPHPVFKSDDDLLLGHSKSAHSKQLRGFVLLSENGEAVDPKIDGSFKERFDRCGGRYGHSSRKREEDSIWGWSALLEPKEPLSVTFVDESDTLEKKLGSITGKIAAFPVTHEYLDLAGYSDGE